MIPFLFQRGDFSPFGDIDCFSARSTNSSMASTGAMERLVGGAVVFKDISIVMWPSALLTTEFVWAAEFPFFFLWSRICQRIPSHTCRTFSWKKLRVAPLVARVTGMGIPCLGLSLMWSLCASWVRAWGWARIGSWCLCASLYVSLQNASLLAMYWLQPLWSRLAALWYLCVSVCNLFFVFFFMCLVMYRFMFFLGVCSWVFFFRAVAVLFGQGTRHKTMCGSAHVSYVFFTVWGPCLY